MTESKDKTYREDELDKILDPVFKLGYEHSDQDYTNLKQAIQEHIEGVEIHLLVEIQVRLMQLGATPEEQRDKALIYTNNRIKQLKDKGGSE